MFAAIRQVSLILPLVAAMLVAGSAPAGTIVRFDTNVASFDVELYDTTMPVTVALPGVPCPPYTNMPLISPVAEATTMEVDEAVVEAAMAAAGCGRVRAPARAGRRGSPRALRARPFSAAGRAAEARAGFRRARAAPSPPAALARPLDRKSVV